MQRRKRTVAEMHTTLRPVPVEAPPLSFEAANFQMLGMREEQQDAFALINALDKEQAASRGLLAVLSDGMGGMEQGGDCAQSAVNAVVEAFQESTFTDMTFFGSYIPALSEELFHQFQGTSGCTLVCAVVQGDSLYWLSVGDSSVYLMRGGRLLKLNTAHNLRTRVLLEQIDRHAVDRELLDRDPEGPRLTAFLGMEALPAPEYTRRPLRLCSGDTLLLCSDGVDGVIDGKRLREILTYPPAQACELLRQEITAFNSPVQDNCTALLIQFQAAAEEEEAP